MGELMDKGWRIKTYGVHGAHIKGVSENQIFFLVAVPEN